MKGLQGLLPGNNLLFNVAGSLGFKVSVGNVGSKLITKLFLKSCLGPINLLHVLFFFNSPEHKGVWVVLNPAPEQDLGGDVSTANHVVQGQRGRGDSLSSPDLATVPNPVSFIEARAKPDVLVSEINDAPVDRVERHPKDLRWVFHHLLERLLGVRSPTNDDPLHGRYIQHRGVATTRPAHQLSVVLDVLQEVKPLTAGEYEVGQHVFSKPLLGSTHDLIKDLIHRVTIVKPKNILELFKHLANGLLEPIPCRPQALGHELLSIDSPVFRRVDILVEVIRRESLIESGLGFSIGVV